MPIDTPYGDRLSPEVRSFLEKVAAGEKVTDDGGWFVGEDADAETARPYNLNDLLRIRKAVRNAASAYDNGDINKRVLLELLDSTDETIKQLIESSGNESAIVAHQKLRDKFEGEMLTLQDPAVHAAREGRLGDVEKALTDARTGPASIRALRQVLGDSWDMLSHSLLARLIAEFRGPDGVVDLDGLTKKLSGMNPDARTQIYGLRGEALMKDVARFAGSSRLLNETTPAFSQAENSRKETPEVVKKNPSPEPVRTDIPPYSRTENTLICPVEPGYKPKADVGRNVAASPAPAGAVSGIGGWLLLLIIRLWIGVAMRGIIRQTGVVLFKSSTSV